MKLAQKLSTLAVGTMVMLFGAIQAPSAALVDNGGGLIYDDVLKITFVQQASRL